MSRTAKYILTILVIGAVALWLLTVYRSCERKKQLEDTTVVSSTGADDTDETESPNQDNEDLYVDEDDNSKAPDEETGDDEEDNSGDDTGTGEANESGGVFADGEADIDGEYLVVAGAFILKENAEAHIRDLEKKGFNAERRVFLGSDYHSVIIGNFETEGAANGVAKKLGSEAYVHKKRYLKKK
jgi:hypothetical protein